MRIAYVVPHCVRENSHGRYVIELATRLENRASVEIFSRAFWDGAREHAKCHFVPVLHRPAIGRLITMWASSAVTPAAHEFDIVHTQGADAPIGNVVTAAYCNAAEADNRRRDRTGVTFEPSRRMMNTIGALAERHCMTKAGTRRVIAVSHAVKREIIRHYDVEPDRIAVIHYGVDVDEFAPAHRERWCGEVRRELDIPSDAFVVVFVGGDYRRKGLIPLMEAVAATGRSNIILLVLGVKPGSDVAAGTDRLRLNGRIRFVGPTPRTSRYFAAADAFALPTRYDTFSLATLEAMATGLPVIVSPDAGVTEIISDGRDGLVLPGAWSIEALTERLMLLVDDTAARASIGGHARRTAEEHSWDRMAHRTVEAYEEVVRARRPTA